MADISHQIPGLLYLKKTGCTTYRIRALLYGEKRLKTERLGEEKKRIGTWGDLNPARLEIVLKHAGKKILDAGCSSGDYVRYFLSQDHDAFGFDILPSEKWEGKLKNRFKSGSLDKIPFPDEEFDTLTVFEVLEHVNNIDTAIEEIKRVTKKNIIISVPDSELYPVFKETGLAFHHWVDRTHIQFFTEESLKKKLEQHHLSIQYFGRINPISPEKLFFENLGVPPGAAKFFAKIHARLPFKKKYLMTLIAVVDKKQ